MIKYRIISGTYCFNLMFKYSILYTADEEVLHCPLDIGKVVPLPQDDVKVALQGDTKYKELEVPHSVHLPLLVLG